MQNKILRKDLVVGIIVLFVGISVMPLVGSISIDRYVSKTCPLGLDLSCNEPYKNVKQGETALFVVEITNIGTISDTYDVIAGSIEDIICKVNGVNADQFKPYEITLESGESISFEISAEVWESVPLGEWYIFVEACSQNDTVINDNLTVTANVQKKNKALSELKEDNNEIEPLDNYCEIITKISGWGEEGTITIKESGKGIFNYVELWSDTYFEISGFRRSHILPVQFSIDTNHIIAPRCLIIFNSHISPGEEMFKAIAFGNIEWS